MRQEYKYLLVDVNALPEVFLKVLHAKELLAQGKASNLSEATRQADISRSAFYKYKDSVFPYLETSTRQIITLYAELLDEPGVLSSLLSTLGSSGANILTINQNIPVDGVAPVSISMRTDRMAKEPDVLLADLRGLYGIVEVKMLAN